MRAMPGQVAGRIGSLLIISVLGAPLARAHDGQQFQQDRQPPYNGPGFRSAVGGVPAVDFPSSGIQLLSWIPIVEFDPTMTSADDCWGYVSPSGREYALIGLSDGTAFVEVTDPGDPQIVAVRNGPNSVWRDIKVYDHYVYAVSEGGSGIQVFDVGQIDDGVVQSLGTVNTPGTSSTHNVAINEDSGFLYRLGGGSGTTNGMRIYDLADAANPTFVGEWNVRYIHDAQIVTYTDGPFAGHEVAFCFSENTSGGGNPGLDILDVTDKSDITSIAFYQYSTPNFSHQGWLSPDRQYLYLNDELDEINLGVTTTTRILNVSDLTNPFEVGTFTSGLTAIDHNLYTRGNLIYEANYRSGLRIFDATDPQAPVQIAFFDTYPEDDNPNFNGLWNNFPYMPSGIMIGSDIEKGLFVWWVGERLLAFDYPEGQPEILNPEGDSFHVQISGQDGGMLDPATATLHYDAGSGWASIAMDEVSEDLFDAVFPAITCGQSVSYYFSAESTNSITWRDPPTAPAVVYQAAVVLDQTVERSDDMESASGWTSGAPGDTAASGLWTRVNPNGTGAQPEDDHTADPASMCWVTGQASPGSPIGTNDVDGGHTTLFSPALDLSTIADPKISYWRWFSNNAGSAPNEDVLTVDISDDNGATWTNVEIVGPTGVETAGGWFYHEFLARDLIVPTDEVQLRFIAEDVGSGSIVEAAIDDLQVLSIDCGIEPVLAPNVTAAGSRYLAVTPAPGIEPVALRVTSPDYPCLTVYVDADGGLAPTPLYRTPTAWGTVLVHGADVVGETTYAVEAENEIGTRSTASEATTALFADVEINGSINFADIQWTVLYFENGPGLSTLETTDFAPCAPDGVVNLTDVQYGILVFEGAAFTTDLQCSVPCN